MELDRWPVTIAFVKDFDGFLIEFVEHHEGTRAGVPDPKQVGLDTTQVREGEAAASSLLIAGRSRDNNQVATRKPAEVHNAAAKPPSR